MRVSIKEVPREVRRLAAQHLESQRGSEIMRGVEAARLDEQAVPVYRPDIDGVAYWEFSIVAGGGQSQTLKTSGFDEKCAPRTGASSAQPIGFIIASNGRHDFPIAHWSLNRLPPSLQVVTGQNEGCSKVVRTSGEPKRLFRLDALSYVAEDDNGEIVGQSGQIPAPIKGLSHDLSRYAGQIVSSIARVLRPEPNDDLAEKAEHDAERSKHEAPALARSDEGGWKALKASYSDSFGPLLAQLRSRAAKTWEIEDAIRKFGEGIIAGTTHRTALLGEACVELVGDGAKYVRATVEEKGAPALVLAAEAVSLPHEVDFDAVITYQDGERERLPFFVVSRDVPSNTKAEQGRNPPTDRGE